MKFEFEIVKPGKERKANQTCLFERLIAAKIE